MGCVPLFLFQKPFAKQKSNSSFTPFSRKTIMGSIPLPCGGVVGRGKLKNLDVTTDVIYSDGLFETIMRHRGPQRLNDNEIEKISTTLRGASIKDKQAKRNHVSRIKWNVRMKERKERDGRADNV
jgi:hypothetical protein